MKVLSLDGGGCLGISHAKILENVDISKFNAIIGTSIGAAVGAVLASGIDLNLPRFFHESIPKIFKGRWYKKYKPWCPRYSDKVLNNILQELFDGTYFGDVKIPLFITAVNVNNRRLKVFYSSDNGDSSYMLWEIVRCSIAAPTYFHSFSGFTDGGIYSNNPSVAAIAGVCSEFKCRVSDIELCSIGTGLDTREVKLYEHTHLRWGLFLLNAMLNGSAGTMNDFICRQLPLKKYERIQFIRDKGWSFDNPSDMLLAENKWYNEINAATKRVEEF